MAVPWVVSVVSKDTADRSPDTSDVYTDVLPRRVDSAWFAAWTPPRSTKCWKLVTDWKWLVCWSPEVFLNLLLKSATYFLFH